MPRAVVCHTIGPYKESVHLTEVPAAEPGKGQAVIQVLSAGISFGEMLVMQGKHFVSRKAPYVLGGGVCGRVTRLGEGCDLKLGGIVFGTSVNGGLQEEAIVDGDKVYPAPEGLDPAVQPVLAGVFGNYGTTYHALKQVANLQPGERLCVLGAAGGIGIAGVELGKAMGAVVVACASTTEKLEACKAAGADVCIEYASPGFKDRIRKEAGGPLDVVYDPVGGEFAEPALRALGFGGRFLVCGFAAGGDNPPSAIPKIALNLALLNERKIKGVNYPDWAARNAEEDRVNMREMVDMMATKKLRPRAPVTLPLENYEKAMDLITGRQAVGTVCLIPSGAKL